MTPNIVSVLHNSGDNVTFLEHGLLLRDCRNYHVESPLTWPKMMLENQHGKQKSHEQGALYVLAQAII